MNRCGQVTRQRILSAACELFAEKGFHDVTHHEICSRAEANIALINYYFGGKDNLYKEVLDETFARFESAWLSPIEGTPEDKLRGLVRNRLATVFDTSPSGFFIRILHHELTWPTPMEEHFKVSYLRKLRARFAGAISDFLGSDASPDDVECLLHSILGPPVLLTIFQHYNRGFFRNGPPEHDRTESIINTMTEIILAGARGLRSKYSNSEKG